MKDFSKTIQNNREYFLIWFSFAFSLVNRVTLIISLLLLLLLLKQGVSGCVKALMLMAMRQVISSKIAVSFLTVQTYKWILLVVFAGYIIINFGKVKIEERTKKSLKWILILSLLYVSYAFVSSSMTSSFPTNSFFKISTFALAFIAVFIGVAQTCKETDYISFFVKAFFLVVIGSIMVIPFGSYNYINGTYQGLINHPNMMGIMMSLFLACFIRSYRNRYITFLVVVIVVMLIIFTNSRTALLVSIATLVLGINYIFPKGANLIYIIVSVISVVFLLLLFQNEIVKSISEFLYKGHESEGIMFSRQGQYKSFLTKFSAHPFIGTGFGVNYQPGITIWSLDTTQSLSYEPGNIIWAVLGDSGIIGMVLFGVLNLSILVKGVHNGIFLFTAAVGITFGEMVFFSVNNMSVIVYVMLAVYLFDYSKREKE